MPDSIKINEKLKIIEVTSLGEVSIVDIASLFSKIEKILNDSGLFKILVDTREQISMPSTSDIFDLFSNFSSVFRVAMLVKKNQMTIKDIQFVETIVQNRSKNVKMFDQKNIALEWLTK